MDIHEYRDSKNPREMEAFMNGAETAKTRKDRIRSAYKVTGGHAM